MLAKAILVHGVIGYKFCWLLPEDQNQGTLAGHESAETPIGNVSVGNAIRVAKCTVIFQRKMDLILKKYQKFVLVYTDEILVFSQTHEDHYDHLSIMFNEFLKNGIIISKKKMELSKEYVDFLGRKIGNDKIKLQEHIVKKNHGFPW